jgi:hypothetical protein
MIPEAVFHESDDRIRLPVLTDSCRFRVEPDKSGHWNTTEPAVLFGMGNSLNLLIIFCLFLFD